MRQRLFVSTPVRFSTAIVLLLGLPVFGGEGMSKLRTQFGDESRRQASNEEVERLLTIVRDERLRQSEPDRVAQAIKRLGELKSTGAINDLIRLLIFKRTFEWEACDMINEIHLTTASERYPAVGALIEIGKPSLPALIDVIGAHDSNSLESRNAWEAVMIVFRDTPTRAVTLLRKAAAKSPSPQSAQRVSYAGDKADELVKKLMQR